MRRLALTAVVLAAAVTAGPAKAQFGMMGRGPSGLMLLGQKSVREDLKLTPEQAEKAEAAVKKQGEEMREIFSGGFSDEARQKMQELNKQGEKTVKEILKPEQAKRLEEISLQQAGGRAMMRPDVAKKLGITEDQQGKIKEELSALREKMQEIFQDGPGPEAREKMQKLNKELNAKIMAMLTDDQKSKWKEMTGKPFTGEIRFGPPGGGQ